MQIAGRPLEHPLQRSPLIAGHPHTIQGSIKFGLGMLLEEVQTVFCEFREVFGRGGDSLVCCLVVDGHGHVSELSCGASYTSRLRERDSGRQVAEQRPESRGSGQVQGYCSEYDHLPIRDGVYQSGVQVHVGIFDPADLEPVGAPATIV